MGSPREGDAAAGMWVDEGSMVAEVVEVLPRPTAQPGAGQLLVWPIGSISVGRKRKVGRRIFASAAIRVPKARCRVDLIGVRVAERRCSALGAGC